MFTKIHKSMQKYTKCVDIFKIFAYNKIAGRDTLYTHVIELTFKRHGNVVEHEGRLYKAVFLFYEDLK